MADANDPGLLTPAETSLLIDRYEITMAASYHRLGRNEPAVFELFVRKLPPHRDWLRRLRPRPDAAADHRDALRPGRARVPGHARVQ